MSLSSPFIQRPVATTLLTPVIYLLLDRLRLRFTSEEKHLPRLMALGSAAAD